MLLLNLIDNLVLKKAAILDRVDLNRDKGKIIMVVAIIMVEILKMSMENGPTSIQFHSCQEKTSVALIKSVDQAAGDLLVGFDRAT